MPFPPRLQFAGATYHVATRATGPSEFFRTPYDYRGFLIILERAVEKYGLQLHAYCLMVTHFHLLVTTPEPNIARGMQYLNSIYARSFNKRYGRLGHFVAARYSSPLIETDGHAYEVSRYVPLNPVRSELCDLPEKYLEQLRGDDRTPGGAGVPRQLVDSPALRRGLVHSSANVPRLRRGRSRLRDRSYAGAGSTGCSMKSSA
jgi:REP element-mobilizing transposase RayT